MDACLSLVSLLRHHVSLELESIDRLYLNVYQHLLQTARGVVGFFVQHRGNKVASSALMEPLSRAFLTAIDRFIQQHNVPLVTFQRGQRKDDLAAQYRAHFSSDEGVVFVGKAQEKAVVFRTKRRYHPNTGQSYAWLVRSSALVNHYYFYCQDRDFGPFFLKFCSYFPYNAKLCLNGHEWLQCQLRQKGIGFEALDNGILSCDDPQRLQSIAHHLSAGKIEVLRRQWLRILPPPFSARDRQAGFRYRLSVLPAEFSLTQVLDRPASGRAFFERVMRENLDLGRPDQVQLIFNRRVRRDTPGRFRTRVITEGVLPSLPVDYKSARSKQYHKEGRALRTETTLNNPREFQIGKRIENLDQLRQLGFAANRRLLEGERISHDCLLAEDGFQQLNHPQDIDGQRVPALRFAEARVQALWSALLLFRHGPTGFSQRELRQQLAPLLGCSPEQLTRGRMSYEWRRLRRRGFIERVAGKHRYRVTDTGWRTALFLTRCYGRLLRPGLGEVLSESWDGRWRHTMDRLDQEIQRRLQEMPLAA
jgi:hypothetical protein